MDSKIISELASIISHNTDIINKYLESTGVAPETIVGTSTSSLPSIPDTEAEVLAAKEQVILATEQLNRLIKGPAETLSLGITSALADLLEVQFVQRFRIAHLVPLEGSISYTDLAEKTGLEADDLRRVLKRARLNQLFQEHDGLISHTAASKILVEGREIAAIADFFSEEAYPSFAKTVEALDRSKKGENAIEQTGFSIANNTSDGMYAYLAKHPARMARFAKAMDAFAANEDFTRVVKAIDWSGVTSVVDVGGAFGPCSIELAQAYPHLRCVVQDFEDVVTEGAARLPPELKERVSFEAHDMFQQQTRVGADVYLFCSIFHNWSDAKCIEILRTHVSAFKQGSQVVVLDWGLATADSTSPVVEKRRRTMDLTMLTFFRGKERSSKDWTDLIEQADRRFKIVKIGSSSPIIHITWQLEPYGGTIAAPGVTCNSRPLTHEEDEPPPRDHIFNITATLPRCEMSRPNGSRSRDGCFNCRRRKRRCDEQKPVCLGCRRVGAECVFPAPRSASTPLKFIVAASPGHYMVPLDQSQEKTAFLNITSNELATICSKFESGDGHGLPSGSSETVDELQGDSDDRLLRTISPYSFSQSPESFQVVEAGLIQYYAEVISSSRVYVQTDRNLFRTSVMPRVLFETGPLLSTVLAMSAAEWGQNIASDGRDYRALSTHYKVQALEALQRSLCTTENAEKNLLTCLLLASLEIAGGSHPAWLRHLQGAIALLENFATTIDPSVTKFVLQYFRFRYILLKTTEPKALLETSTSADREASFDDAMDRLAGTVSSLSLTDDASSVIDEHIGCSMELVDVINQISALSMASKNAAEGSYDQLHTHGQRLEHQLMQIKCRVVGDVPDEYLSRSAECFRTAAQIYLRLVCYGVSIENSSILEPHTHLLACLSEIITVGLGRRLFPMWPLFIAGCTCSSDEQRIAILNHFSTLDSQWPISNISAVWKAVRTVWQARDFATPQTSSKEQDWQEIIHKFGWKLSLS